MWRFNYSAKGGEKAREITPLGYCGDPSEINIKSAEIIEKEMAGDITKMIYEFFKKAK